MMCCRFCVRPPAQRPGVGFLLWASCTQCDIYRNSGEDEWSCVPHLRAASSSTADPTRVNIAQHSTFDIINVTCVIMLPHPVVMYTAKQ